MKNKEQTQTTQKAVIYARFSSDKQTEQSIEGQVRVCKKFADDNNMSIVDTYVDRAISGRTDHRPAFQKMLKDSASKSFDFVIVYKLDRFARNRYDSAINKATLKKNGVKLLSAVENITDSPEGIILESMLEGMAEYYSVELAQKVKRGQYETLQKKRFLGGSVPYGYKIVNKQFAINDTQTEIVKEIFNKYSNGTRIKDIVNWLNSLHILNNTGTPFTKSTITHILNNKKYIGIFTYNNTEYKNYLPAIIDEQTFDNVQSLMNIKHRNKKSKTTYALSGKLYCGHCGSLMTGETGTSHTGMVYNYYKCFGKKKHSKCDKKNIAKNYIEKYVATTALKIILAPTVRKKIIEKIIEIQNNNQEESILENLEAQKKELKQQQKNIVNAIKNGFIDITLKDELGNINCKLTDIETKIAEYQLHIPTKLTYEQIDFWFSQFENADMTDDRVVQNIIDTFIRKVILYDNKITIVCNTSNNNSISCDWNNDDMGSNYDVLAVPRKTMANARQQLK